MGLRWLLAAALIAGCASAPSPPVEPPPGSEPVFPPGEPVADPEGARGNTTASEPFEVVLYLTEQRSLGFSPPAAGNYREGTSLFDPRFLAGGAEIPTWLAQAQTAGWAVRAGRLDLWFSSDAPKVAMSEALGFEPVVAWLGHDEAFGTTNQLPAPSTLAPGEVIAVSGDFVLPSAGLVVEAGQTPALMLAFGYGQSEADPIVVHVGGERASRLTLTVAAYDAPPSSPRPEERFSGTFQANSGFLPAPGAGETTQRFPLSLDGAEAKVEAVLASRDATGPVDLDLALIDPSGETLVIATTPRGEETVEAYDLHLAGRGGEYTLEVSNFQSLQTSFDLTVRVHARANATAG